MTLSGQCCRCLDACIAQLGERQTEDLKVPGSIPGVGTFFHTLPNKNGGKKALSRFELETPSLQD